MPYAALKRRLDAGEIVVIDGGTGTELERRGARMDPEAWCGPATLENVALLEEIHLDYIAAGAQVITANTFASSRLMLEPAGLGDQVAEINRTAIQAAHRAVARSGREDVVVAGSLSHMHPMTRGTAVFDPVRAPTEAQRRAAFDELAGLMADEGCDLILLEMMYHPDRMPAAFGAACATGLPVWAGFSARRGADGAVLSFASDRDIPFAEIVAVLADHPVDAAGIMHTPSDLIEDALAVLDGAFDGALMAYPDSGHFKMPEWQFENVISCEDLRAFAAGWVGRGAQILGGCCGLSPEHIRAMADLKGKRAVA